MMFSLGNLKDTCFKNESRTFFLPYKFVFGEMYPFQNTLLGKLTIPEPHVDKETQNKIGRGPKW